MKLNHFANRVTAEHFETIIAMLKENLGFVELRRTRKSIWMRQSGANIDLQFNSSSIADRDPDKNLSQVSFLSDAPAEALENLATWANSKGLEALVGSYSSKEFYLDVPAAFVDFVIEAMTPDCADYDVDAEHGH